MKALVKKFQTTNGTYTVFTYVPVEILNSGIPSKLCLPFMKMIGDKRLVFASESAVPILEKLIDECTANVTANKNGSEAFMLEY